jgi:tetratricopeptide (TPR) repeat protein
MPTPLLSNFTPSLMSPETLERIFVQREDIAQDLVDRIILSATTPAKHHSLLIGARGMGKTHLVSLVYYRLDQHQELKDKLMVAWLREEEWGVDSWLDLVVRIFRSLEETKVDTKGLLAQLQQVSISDAETLATQLLTGLIGDKTLLLIVENLDELFAGLGEKGQQKFRSFLQERQCCTILATTPALFAGVQNSSEPFFGFFNPIPLSPLNWEEATVMLQKIAELDGQADLANFLHTPAGKARVRAVHHLAGGNPRVYTLFAQFITRESLDELVQAFMKMLDDLTPYYQSRMKELSNQQRKIVEFLVDRREAVMVKEIATQCFIEQRVVSGQLLQLRNKGYVVARANGRESFYELTEVLMRLCMEVKKYRGQWVELFVDFLRIWYRPAERQAKLAMLRGNGGLISDEHLELALMSDADPVLVVVSREFQNCIEENNQELALQVLAELQAIGGIGYVQYQQIVELINVGNFDEVRAILDRTVETNSNDVQELLSKGVMLAISEKWSESLALFDRFLMIDTGNIDAFLYRGRVLDELGRYEEAITSYDRALEIKSNDYDTWYRRGHSLFSIGKYEEAILNFDSAIKFKPDKYEAWNNKGYLLNILGRYEEALVSYDRAIEIKSDENRVWNNRGCLLAIMDRQEEAIANFDLAIKLKSDDRKSWYNKGIALHKEQRYEEAISSYDRSIELNPDDDEAWHNRANSLSFLGKYQESIASYEKAISIKPEKYESWHSKGFLLFAMNNCSAALVAWDRAFEIIRQAKNTPYEITSLIQGFIILLIPKFTQPAVKTMLTELVQTYIQTSVLTELGTALVRTLKQILAPDISDYTAQQWLTLWQELLGDRPEMQLPFRLMTTAILYKQHPERKERLWLGLASEERSILDEALE